MMESIILNGIVNAISSVLISETYEGIKSIIKTDIDRTSILFSDKDLEDNIINEIRKTANWAFDDLFKNHNDNSDITARYVHLDLLLEPRREHTSLSQSSRKRPLKEIILEDRGNTVILGQPGSGKTTSVKYIVNSILTDPEFLQDKYRLPIVIRLRELNKSNSVLSESQEGGIFEKLSLIFGLNLSIKYKKRTVKKESKTEIGKEDNREFNIGKKEDDDNLKTLLRTKIIPYILDSQKVLLILDGFDEIIDQKTKNLVISEIKELTRSLNKVNFILTSRSSDYKLLLEGTSVYEISELNSSQIKEFADRWFEDLDLSDKFLAELYSKTPYKDFYARPLLLTQLAQIYSRTNEIPDKPKMIYQRIVELVLKEWNEKQGLKRTTRYTTFTVERKREFLANMAFNLKIKHNSQVFSRDDLSLVYKELNNKFKELPRYEVEEVIEEIETHNGLIIKSGFDSFEFSHLTIQEYFVADYIVRVGNIRRFKCEDLIKLPNELAIAVALSSEPSVFLYDLIVEFMFKKARYVDTDFLIKFFNRIKLEKPDFEVKNDAMSIITLLSIYSNIGMEEDFPSFTTEETNNLSMLETAILSFSDGKIEHSLKGCYKKLDITSRKGRSFIVYEKTASIDRNILNNSFPQYLYWKTT